MYEALYTVVGTLLTHIFNYGLNMFFKSASQTHLKKKTFTQILNFSFIYNEMPKIFENMTK